MLSRKKEVPQSADFPEVMNRTDVALFLGISIKTVEKYTKKGQIPHKRLGHRVLYSKTRLLRWVENDPIYRELPPF